MRVYRGRAYQAACAGKEAVRQFMPRTIKRIADHRNLDVAFHHIAVHGGEAPGPSGLALADLTRRQLLDMIKIVSQQIADGSYRPGPERRLNVSKAGGNGTRPLKLQNIEDRGVGRALLQVLQPLVDATFDSRSFGSRPHLGRLDALAEAAVLCTHEERTIWLVADVKNAFEQVPHNRLLDVVRDRLPSDELAAFLRTLLHNERNTGLRQGSPFSPFLCNLYLDHFLDRPWRKRHPDVPLVRYLDDVLVLCRAGDDVSGVQQDLLNMLRTCGMSAKPVSAENRCDLVAGESISWLGYEIRLGQSGLEFRLPLHNGRLEWLERLHEKFSLVHAGSHAHLVAWRAVEGLADQLGPVFRFEDLAALWPAIEALARARFSRAAGPRAVRQTRLSL